VKFSDEVSISPSVIILDGISGTGKTLLGPLLSQLSDFAPPRFYYPLEWLAAGLYKDCVDSSFARAWVQLVFDQLAYDAQISREINFRPGDLSTNFGYGNRINALTRLFRKDGPYIGKLIEEEGLGITVITHQIFPTYPKFSSTLDPKIMFIQAVRRPSDLLEHWSSYVDRHGTCKTDFTLSVESSFGSVPWFLSSDPAEYLSSDTPNRAAILLCDLFETLFNLREDSGLSSSILFVPFEEFIVSPQSFLDEISIGTGKKFKPRLQTEMRRQKVPRLPGLEGKKDQAYERYKIHRKDSRTTGLGIKRDLLEALTSPLLSRLNFADFEYERLFLTSVR